VTEGPPPTPGLRWPAEWEPHAATWLAWPHNPDTWPGRLEAARDEFTAILRALRGRERVNLLVADEAAEEAVRCRLAGHGVDPEEGLGFHRLPTNDAWIRDYGPWFLAERDGEGRQVVVDFRFDAWGGKYPPWDLDDGVPGRVAAALDLERLEAGFVLEGGAVDGNGRGTVLTTESCLLNPNRGPDRCRDAMERRLAAWLGAQQVLWLAGGIEGDDTDGHVDDVARFVGATTVVAAVEEDPADPNFAPLAENLRRLRSMRDPEGRPLSVVSLPMPPAHRKGGHRCPASYANFYLANGVALVPVFGTKSDERALAVLAEVLPDREVVGIPCANLVMGLGAVHCLTQQEPARPPAPREGRAPDDAGAG
jgi:agmatine deiminase